MARWVLAADFGGTHLRAAVVAEDGSVGYRADRRTPAQASAGEMVGLVLDLLGEVVGVSGVRPEAVCIATAGLVNANEGKVIFAPNIAGFRDVVLTTPVAQRLGIPAFIENDASAAALGEFRYGAGRGTRHLLHATLGTGIGGGLVIDRRLYRGAQGLAGEIGHMVVDPSGPRCACGSRGCLEALVSGVAFAARARRLLEQGKSAVLKEIVGYEDPTGVHLFEAARRGDRASEAEIRNGGHFLGLGLGSLVNVLNPDAVTLSGGLLAMGEMLLGPMREAMRSMAYGAAGSALVRVGELGEDTGLLGAAAVAFERLELG